MKRLDHPYLPRIVGIIDNGVTVYVVMDYVEGESLSKSLHKTGAQPEESVIRWAKQLCEALGYLHSQKPPIVYQDMKPGNIMLKPDGNVKIIDFGAAREVKERNSADIQVLGTKGYAPPEQKKGQLDPRSDIFALGMTMHHLLTGVNPKGQKYVPVRLLNPKISEGLGAVIDKCVEPKLDDRYQSCEALLYDLNHLDLLTSGYRRKQKKKVLSFAVTAGLFVVMMIAGIVFNFAAVHVNNYDYDILIGTADPTDYYGAIDIYPERTDAYNKLIEYYKNHGAENDEIKRLRNAIENHSSNLDVTKADVADLYYDMGKLYFSDYDDTLKSRAAYAKDFFEVAVGNETGFDKKGIAECYCLICDFMGTQNKTEEHTLADYNDLFAEIESAMAVVEESTDNEANYDKISLYYVTMLLINDQAEYMAGVGFDKQEALDLLENLYIKSMSITSTLSYVAGLQEKIETNYSSFVDNLNAKYNEVEKRQNGGN